jgi:hypothetical protein
MAMIAANVRAVRGWPLPTLTVLMNDADRKKKLSFAILWAMWQRDVSPPKLGRAIHKSADTVRRWRDGDGTPNALDLGPLAEALGLRVDYFTNPPDLPDYPFAEYETANAPGMLAVARQSGVEEGLRRGRKSQAQSDPDTPAQSPAPRTRGSAAERG